MAMFSMFVATPPAGTPVNTVYREKQAFGPLGVAAGEVSPDSGFSEALWMEAPEEFRSLRAICSGKIHVVGVQKGFPPGPSDSPLVVELTPGFHAFAELERLCQAAKTETPQRFLYHGLSPNSLRENMGFYFDALSATSGPVKIQTSGGQLLFIEDIGKGAFLDGFLSGNNSIFLVEDLAMGFSLGEVSDKNKNLNATHFAFGIEVRTGLPIVYSMPLSTLRENRLDPVVLFHTLTTARLSDSSEAIAPAEVANSWLEVVTKNRVLITFRDEWNAALNSGESAIAEGPGAGQVVDMLLNDQQAGTIVAPDGWGQYTCQVSVPPSRKLTHIPSDRGASDQLTLTASAPAHLVVGSIRPEDWFQPTTPGVEDHSLDLPLYTEGNYVRPLVDGFATFSDMALELDALNDPSPGDFNPEFSATIPQPVARNFVLLADWALYVDFPLLPGDPNSTVLGYLSRGVASEQPVLVRALAWAGVHFFRPTPFVKDNTVALAKIDLLDPARSMFTRGEGDALGDPGGVLPSVWSFHWKSSVIRNKRGTVAYLGGVDLNPNRLDGPEHLPTDGHYYDVHCRIQGPAAPVVADEFLFRWDLGPGPEEILEAINPTADVPTELSPTHMVQIARTLNRHEYPGAPEGDRTIWATLQQAIRRAKRYIYLEDQYMIAPMLRDELLAALQRSQQLEVIFVIPEKCEDFFLIADQEGYDRARYLFFYPQLISHSRVQVYYVRQTDYFVHSKVRIIDDVFATIGSANANRRSLTHDAELNAFILDGRIEEGSRKFARDLRTRLWAEHLAMPLTEASFATLSNIDSAINILKTLKSSRLFPYTVKNPGSDYTFEWDKADPDGS